MSTKLRIIGGGIVFIGILAGVVSRSLLGFVIYLVASITSAAIYFALGEILDNQDVINSRIGQLEHNSNRGLDSEATRKSGMKKCLSCGKETEDMRNSCPYCGGREFL